MPTNDLESGSCCSMGTVASARLVSEPGSATGRIVQGIRSAHIIVDLDIPAETLAYGLEVVVPPGWSVSSVSENGEWDETHRKLKWGPYFDTSIRKFEFQLHPNDSSARLRGLIGTASFDGFNQPIEWHRAKPARPKGR
jgi:hypothetical protein